MRLDSKVLDPVCCKSSPSSSDTDKYVCDELLHWHLRQSVLANMRDAGTSSFKFDYPPGSDMVGKILASVNAESE